jgi:glycosyltransferase involved in cell wall biosynthesis
MPKVSVVIPCYNHGHFLNEAVESVLKQSFQDLDIIIINDGSTDTATNTLLAEYDRPKTRVITTENQGLAAARNNGIVQAQGEYILTLDADDKIEASYIEKAVDILDRHPGIGIVYCRASLFGQVETEWHLPEYSIEAMLLDNIIFCTALYRKQDWLLVGGYDPGMIYGWEDYDFWLSLIERGREVWKIPEMLFFYRITADSMVRSKERSQKVAMFKRIFDRHPALFHKNIEIWIDKVLAAAENYYTSRLYVDTGYGVSDALSVARKVDKDTIRLTFDVRQFSPIVHLRFDPADTYAVVEIRRVLLLKEDGTKLEVNSFSGNETYIDHGRLLFATLDSQCFFDLQPDHLSGLSDVQIDLCFHALDKEALVYILQFQHNRIQVGKDPLSQTEGFWRATGIRHAQSKADNESLWAYMKRHFKSFIGIT